MMAAGLAAGTAAGDRRISRQRGIRVRARACLPAALLLLLLGVPGAAAVSPDGDADKIAAERVLAVAEADWNGDGRADRAVLVASATEPDQADPLIFLSGSAAAHAAGDALRLAEQKAGLAWRGEMAGTAPGLSLNPRGSLLVRDANESIGRSRWSRTLTLAFRDGRFVVAGYTFSGIDTLDLDARSECDVNFLAGRGVHNGRAFRIAAGAIPLAAWSEERVPGACG